VKPLVLVTGGAGFIGSHLVELLLERGYPVRVYDKLVEQVHDGSPPKYLAEEAEFVHADMRDVDALRRALKGVGAILHEAAEVGVGQSMYEIVRYVEANTGGTAVLLELLVNEAHAIEKIVVASSMSIYGEGAYRCERHGEVYPRLRSEDQLARQEWAIRCPRCGEEVRPVPTHEEKPLFPTSIYAISKLDQELMCLSVGQAYGIPVTALRYFNTYGPRQALSNPYTGVGAIFSARLLNGRPPIVFEDGRQSRDFVHVNDIARANLLALESDAANGEAINVGTGRSTSILEIARALARELAVEIEPEVVGQYRAGDIRDCIADVSKARALLGFEPEVRLEDGIADLVAWVREQEAVDRVDPARAELERRGLAR
jgi:dTDP-L-rhamnose 4-epimerase